MFSILAPFRGFFVMTVCLFSLSCDGRADMTCVLYNIVSVLRLYYVEHFYILIHLLEKYNEN